jgi:hypothetical protein
MKKLLFAKHLLAAAVLFGAGTTLAADLQIEWNNPDHWQDAKATDINQQRYIERVKEVLGDQFRHEAERLPAGQKLIVSVNDVDLAGEIEYFHRNYPFGLRVIRNVDSPRIDLNYELRDADDHVVKTGEEKLRDPGFRYITLANYDRNVFRYERALIRDWSRKELLDQ